MALCFTAPNDTFCDLGDFDAVKGVIISSTATGISSTNPFPPGNGKGSILSSLLSCLPPRTDTMASRISVLSSTSQPNAFKANAPTPEKEIL